MPSISAAASVTLWRGCTGGGPGSQSRLWLLSILAGMVLQVSHESGMTAVADQNSFPLSCRSCKHTVRAHVQGTSFPPPPVFITFSVKLAEQRPGFRISQRGKKNNEHFTSASCLRAALVSASDLLEQHTPVAPRSARRTSLLQQLAQ